ncbi:MAG: hypothetical protein ACYTF1_27760, partial [Planctomycetota bacterium]
MHSPKKDFYPNFVFYYSFVIGKLASPVITEKKRHQTVTKFVTIPVFANERGRPNSIFRLQIGDSFRSIHKASFFRKMGA